VRCAYCGNFLPTPAWIHVCEHPRVLLNKEDAVLLSQTIGLYLSTLGSSEDYTRGQLNNLLGKLKEHNNSIEQVTKILGKELKV
jgi:hypothetical protein